MGDMRFDVVDSLKVALPHGMGSKWDGTRLDPLLVSQIRRYRYSHRYMPR